MLKGHARAILIIAIYAISISAYSQNNFPDKLVPSITAPSPTAYNLGKYGDVPVSTYTGLPSVSIPLYTIKTKSIEIPIALSYHAASIKVRDEASPVGFGWSLIAGGVITQNIADVDDFENAFIPMIMHGYGQIPIAQIDQGLCNEPTVGIDPVILGSTRLNDYFGLYGYQNLNIDLEPDLFNFNFLGYSGKFAYNKETQEIILLDQQNIKFILNQDKNTPTSARDWTVLLPDGTELTFGVVEIVEGPNYVKNDIIRLPRVRSWYLTKIVTTNRETIDFTYNHLPETVNPTLTARLLPSVFETSSRIDFEKPIDPDGPGAATIPTKRYDDGVVSSETYLQIISFDQGEVRFGYDLRNDLEGLRLSTLDVYAKSDSPSGFTQLRKYVLNNDAYFSSQGTLYHAVDDVERSIAGLSEDCYKLRLKLNGLNEIITGAKYSFVYNSELLPYKDGYAVDYWGYNTGRNANKTLVPDITKLYPESDIYAGIEGYYDLFKVADRSTDPQKVKAAVLEEIHYPTGGYTKFDYEPNSFSNYPSIFPKDRFSNSLGGGIRILRITDFDGAGHAMIKKFLYRKEGSEVSSGKLLAPLQYQRTYLMRNIACPTQSPGPGHLLPPYFTNATYFIIEGQSHTALSNGAQGQSVGYDRVEVLHGENGENGREIFYYNNFPDEYYQYSYGMPNSMPNVSNPLNGTLKMKKVMNQNLQTLMTEEYDYQEVNMKSVDGMKTYNITELNRCNPDCQQFVATGYSLKSDRVDMISKKTSVWNPANDQQMVTTETYIHNRIGLVSETNQNQSDGSTTITKHKFPVDYFTSEPPANPASVEFDGLYKMYLRNMHTVPVEEVRLRNNNVISAQLTDFKDVTDTSVPLIVPLRQWKFLSTNSVPLSTTETSETFEMSSYNVNSQNTLTIKKDDFYGVEPDVTYDVFDNKGNLLQYHAKRNIMTSFVWGYNQSQVIAKVANAQAKDIFYTGFEDEETGPFDLLNKKTGAKSCSDASILSYPLTNLTNGTYILSYWKKQDDWLFVENKVTVSSGSYTIAGLTGQVDDLRFYPENAQMTTYTYDFLKGVTSQCDPNNIIKYFEYDPYGRLSNVKDLDKNLLQHVDYNYAH